MGRTVNIGGGGGYNPLLDFDSQGRNVILISFYTKSTSSVYSVLNWNRMDQIVIFYSNSLESNLFFNSESIPGSRSSQDIH